MYILASAPGMINMYILVSAPGSDKYVHTSICTRYDKYRGCASRSPARPRRVKPNSGELKLYVISPGWRVELLLSFKFSIRY